MSIAKSCSTSENQFWKNYFVYTSPSLENRDKSFVIDNSTGKCLLETSCLCY